MIGRIAIWLRCPSAEHELLRRENAYLALGAKKTRLESEALRLAASAVRAGARGVVFGRNVVQAHEPERFLDALKEVVKTQADPDQVAAKYRLE